MSLLGACWCSMLLLLLLQQDVYDKQRSKLIKQLKADALNWVSKYARGGSVRARSAREM
jgi:hypothetical protein